MKLLRLLPIVMLSTLAACAQLPQKSAQQTAELAAAANRAATVGGTSLAPIVTADRRTDTPDEEIGRWRLRCLRNQTRAEVECFAVNRVGMNQARVTYFRDLRGGIDGPYVRASPGNDCPGEAAVLRVDDRLPERIYYPTRTANAAAMMRIVRQMEGGSLLRSEGRRWPYCTPRDEAHEIDGFAAAHVRLVAMIRATRP